MNVRDEYDKGIIVEDIKTSPYIISIFQHYASENGHSLEALGQIMFKEGFKDKYGNPYKARKFEEILKTLFIQETLSGLVNVIKVNINR